MTEYKPLTPEYRREIYKAFDKSMTELQTCESNSLVNIQIAAMKQAQKLICSLPDGFPIPLRKD